MPLSNPKEDHEAFSHFALSCACGAKVWRVIGYREEPEALLCPITLKCEACGSGTEVFDVEKHGYDAELGNGCWSRRKEGEETEFLCPECNAPTFDAAAIVSYQTYEDDIDEEMSAKMNDLFDTFSLAVSCLACGNETSACDYECS